MFGCNLFRSELAFHEQYKDRQRFVELWVFLAHSADLADVIAMKAEVEYRFGNGATAFQVGNDGRTTFTTLGMGHLTNGRVMPFCPW